MHILCMKHDFYGILKLYSHIYVLKLQKARNRKVWYLFVIQQLKSQLIWCYKRNKASKESKESVEGGLVIVYNPYDSLEL